MDKCWAEGYCKQFNAQRSNCHEFCIGYVQLENIYALSNIPKRYQFDIPLTDPGPDKQSYLNLRDWMNAAYDNIVQGKGLFLFSTTKGNGKTSWACKIGNEYIRKVALRNNMRCRVLFVNVPEFLEGMRGLMDKDPETYNADDRRIVAMQENIRSADLVIWDDIGTETPTRWVREQLYIYINYRDSNGKSQIYTSNLGTEIMSSEQYLGERIVSRIVGHSDVIEFKGRDRRKG